MESVVFQTHDATEAFVNVSRTMHRLTTPHVWNVSIFIKMRGKIIVWLVNKHFKGFMS